MNLNKRTINDNSINFECGCSFPRNGTNISFCMDTYNSDHNIKWDCPYTYQLISEGLTQGVFQLCSFLGQQWSKKVLPTELEHISALTAILRPGCLQSQDDEGLTTTIHYERRKNKKEEIKPFHPIVDKILKDTYGCLIYQEGAMQIAAKCGGFTLQEANTLRSAIGKKIPELMSKMKKLFLEKAHDFGILTDEQAIEVFNWIEASQRYAFNHSLTYDTIVETPNGFKTLLEVIVGDKVKSNNGFVNVVNKYDHGLQEVFKITLESNKTIECTLAHKFSCQDGKIRKLKNIIENNYKINCRSGFEYIVLVKKTGIKPTLDIEVDNENHLYYANEILTSNSHALSYAVTSYITAYQKAHFPVQFYKSWLYNEGKREEYPKLINEAKLFDIEVHTPDITHVQSQFHAQKNHIYFGIENIKGVMAKDLAVLATRLTELNIRQEDIGKMSWLSFLYEIADHLSSQTVKGLISTGALGCFGMDRALMLYEYTRWDQLTDKEKTYISKVKTLVELTELLKSDYETKYQHKIVEHEQALARRLLSKRTYKTELKAPEYNQRFFKVERLYQELISPLYKIVDTVDSTIFMEENLLGVALTKHKTDEIALCGENASVADILRGREDYSVLRVKVESVRTWEAKNGTMCFLEVSDKTARMTNTVAFFETYNDFRHLLVRGNLVYICGAIGDKGSFIVKRVYGVD